MNKLVLGLLLVGCGANPGGSGTGGGGGSAAVPIDCSGGNSVKACESWTVDESPFMSRYGSHTCVQWKDAAGVTLHSSSVDACKPAEGADPNTIVRVVDHCPETARSGGCMAATEYSCEVQYYYHDDSLETGRAVQSGDVQTLCSQAGSQFVE